MGQVSHGIWVSLARALIQRFQDLHSSLGQGYFQQSEREGAVKTGFFWDEKCFWHGGGNYALTLPVGGDVQPLVAGGLPESEL